MGNIGRQLALVRNLNHLTKSALANLCLRSMLVSWTVKQMQVSEFISVLRSDSLRYWPWKWFHLIGFSALVFSFSMNTNSFRRRPIRTEGPLRPLLLQQSEARGTYQRTSSCSIRTVEACPTRPELLIGCLLLSNGHDSIFDWLLSGHSELRWLLTELRQTMSWVVVFVLLFISTYLRGISSQAAIVLQISFVVPNSHTGSVWKSALITVFMYQWRTHSIWKDMHP